MLYEIPPADLQSGSARVSSILSRPGTSLSGIMSRPESVLSGTFSTSDGSAYCVDDTASEISVAPGRSSLDSSTRRRKREIQTAAKLSSFFGTTRNNILTEVLKDVRSGNAVPNAVFHKCYYLI